MPLLPPSRMRDHEAAERPSTPLELLFDLCFVVAVAALAAELHHGIVAGHAALGTVAYMLLFVPVWWAWMSYTWFATAFSHDDPLTRLLTLLQMGGVLAVAATVPAAAEGEVVPFAVAYALMRLPLVLQWLRAAYDDAPHRGFALTYAAGSVAGQALWVAGSLAYVPIRPVVYAAALAVELATPVLAVHRSPGRVFHPRHIAERYGLFTIIVLGETILAVAVGLGDALDGDGELGNAAVIVVAALVIAFGMWWIYFDTLGSDGLTRNRGAAFTWGYGHYALFAAVAAIGAGVQVQLEAERHAHVGDFVALASVAVPVAIALAAVAWLQHSANRQTHLARRLLLGAIVCAGLISLATLVSPATADLLLAAVVVTVVIRGLVPAPEPDEDARNRDT